ncbi:hypothetical protein PVAR5_2590 [Paecilomyces variotii No. 5]|uniref:DUF6314 domain-containing protein n=1 Tax=Byssochlamys spectabilis (strain No. 5 / NBRC 109023) TaxID=1356009 RepID=V5HW40_BYSSN|nr:hypothetical protein PVAR5_2590 [Paecilomyces variotii No. 5]
MTAANPPQQQPDPETNPNMILSKGPASVPSPQLLSALFTSLARPWRPWRLTRTLRSDNPHEINGQLTGTATFAFLKQGSDSNANANANTFGPARDMLYREEGEMPSTVIRGMAGLRWTKKYIWRLREDGAGISVWFVKVGGAKTAQNQEEPEDEADYLFHEFEFSDSSASGASGSCALASRKEDQDKDAPLILVTPPTPPVPSTSETSTTAVLTARGNHLCINDMYRTAYSFRIRPETGEVLSWASRHVVKGPKKDQDIVNLYTLDD